jgi:hypothetical protein
VNYQIGTPTIAQLAPQSHATDGFRNPTSLTRLLKTLLWVHLALVVIEAVLTLALVGAGAAELQDVANGLASIASIGGLESIATAVVFLLWVYRANSNARRLGAVGMKFPAGWAVGWYFIPIANLFVPFLTMREIWRASANPGSWAAQRAGWVVPCWWLLFLVSKLADGFSGLVWNSAHTLELIKGAAAIGFLAGMLDAIAIPFAIMLVGRICRMQMASRERALQNAFV